SGDGAEPPRLGTRAAAPRPPAGRRRTRRGAPGSGATVAPTVTAPAPADSRRAFLFSVDLEDVRSMIPDGERHAPRVAANLDRYLALLERHGVRCTFFTVGELARREPGLIRRLVDAGHEVACHGADHEPLERLGPAGFRDDLRRALDALHES